MCVHTHSDTIYITLEQQSKGGPTVKLYRDFGLCVGSVPLTPVLLKGQPYIYRGFTYVFYIYVSIKYIYNIYKIYIYKTYICYICIYVLLKDQPYIYRVFIYVFFLLFMLCYTLISYLFTLT